MKPPDWLYRRTRLLNMLHFLRVAKGHSQMTEEEKIALKKYAFDKERALEIGTYMGVSANLIAKALIPKGVLYCVDPFLDRKGKKNPGWAIAERDLERNKVRNKVTILRGFSSDPLIQVQIPDELDFIFVDGDHSYEGLANDWQIVKQKLKLNGEVCLHDTLIPAKEPYRNFGSVQYFQDIIKLDTKFNLIDQCYSMTVLKKII